MPGRGPAPKPASRRARTNKDPVPTTTLRFEFSPQPALPSLGEDFDWHVQTVKWWDMWGRAPQAQNFTESDWQFLIDTALMHHAMWSKGQWTLAAEVRLRVAKFGATPEDRARLRMVFADADEKDEKRAAKKASVSREKFGPLHAVPKAAGDE
jgi:hypothetical protein